MKKQLICLLLFLTVGFSQSPITPANLPYYISELYLNRTHIDSILAADSTSIYIEGIGIVDTSLIGYLNQDETITGYWNTDSILVNESIRIGTGNTKDDGDITLLVGEDNTVSGNKSVAIGADNSVLGNNGLAVGLENIVGNHNAVGRQKCGIKYFSLHLYCRN